MNNELFWLYLISATAVIVVPGPNVLFIVSQSLHAGVRAGLESVAGASLAMVVQLLAVGFGLASILTYVVDYFQIFKWFGVVYLVYLAYKQWRHAVQTKPSTPRDSAYKGFLISLTNPKQLIFFAAFIPQFVDTSLPVAYQLWMLSLAYVLIALVSDVAYVLLAAWVRGAFAQYANRISKVSSVFLLGAAAWLVSMGLAENKAK